MQDQFDHVNVGLHGLWVEEVVRLEGYAVAQVRGRVGVEGGFGLGEVLHDDFQVGEVLGQDNAVVTSGTAELQVKRLAPLWSGGRSAGAT